MSAITETEPGGQMVCILGFSARPRDLEGSPMPGARRTFRVGERVRYLTHSYEGTPEDNPIGYLAFFAPLDPKDENRYAATQDYFVSLDCWEGLRKHFASSLIVIERDRVSGSSGDRPDIEFELEGAYRLVEIKEVPASRGAS